MLNLNNPIQETVRFRSVGSGITLLLSVPKGRDICECRRKSVICYTRAKRICRSLLKKKEVLVNNTSFTLCKEAMQESDGENGYRSSETVSFFLPFLRRAAKTFLPLAVDILWRKPCLLALFLRDGWNVLFIFYSFLELQKYEHFFNWQKK